MEICNYMNKFAIGKKSMFVSQPKKVAISQSSKSIITILDIKNLRQRFVNAFKSPLLSNLRFINYLKPCRNSKKTSPSPWQCQYKKRNIKRHENR